MHSRKDRGCFWRRRIGWHGDEPGLDVLPLYFLGLLFLGSAGAAWLISFQKQAAVEQREMAQLQEARAVSALARRETEHGDAMTGMLATLSLLPNTAKQDPRPHSAPAEMALLDALLSNREVMAMIGHTNQVGVRRSVRTVPGGDGVFGQHGAGLGPERAAPVSTVLAGHTDWS